MRRYYLVLGLVACGASQSGNAPPEDMSAYVYTPRDLMDTDLPHVPRPCPSNIKEADAIPCFDKHGVQCMAQGPLCNACFGLPDGGVCVLPSGAYCTAPKLAINGNCGGCDISGFLAGALGCHFVRD